MSAHRFVGSYAKVYDTPIEIKTFGQLVDVPDEHVHKIAGLLPPQDFDALGFTADDLNPYKPKSAEFEKKRVAAHAAAKAYRERLMNRTEGTEA